MRPCGLKAAVLAIITLSLPGAAGAAGFDQFVGLGDSTMDSGYFLHNSTGGLETGQSAVDVDGGILLAYQTGGTGTFTGPGVMNTTMLAARFGLTALPVGYPGGGGTNYANGSAQTVLTTQQSLYTSGFLDNVPTVAQIANYLAAVDNAANPNALYMISTGANDLFWMQTKSSSSQFLYQTYMVPFAADLADSVATLQADGARTIIVLDLNEYARLVGPNGAYPQAKAAVDANIVADARLYSATIWSSLAAAGVRFVPIDINSLFTYVVQNPTSFGFSAQSVLGSNAACSSSVSSGILCTPAALVAPNAEQTHLWADGVHLTTAGQTIEVDYIYSLLTAPSEISLLAETAVQGRLARAATVQGQIDLSGEHRGPTGINAWVSAGASSLSVKNAPNFPDTSGTPFGGSVGVDYRTPVGVIVGLAFTGGGQTQNFSIGGHFTQTDAAPSLYAAYQAGPVWGNAVASYDLLQDHVARQVALGSFTDQNSGNTSGHDPALALRGGWDFHLGPVTTGPVAGVVLQQVRLDGFTETGTSGVTALSFGSQTRNSAVSQLGWRAAATLGDWQPFAEMDWNHEWAGGNRTDHGLAHLDCCAVLQRRRGSGGRQLGHCLARRRLQAQRPGDAARRGVRGIRQSAGDQLRRRARGERRFLRQNVVDGQRAPAMMVRVSACRPWSELLQGQVVGQFDGHLPTHLGHRQLLVTALRGSLTWKNAPFDRHQPHGST